MNPDEDITPEIDTGILAVAILFWISARFGPQASKEIDEIYTQVAADFTTNDDEAGAETALLGDVEKSTFAMIDLDGSEWAQGPTSKIEVVDL